MIAMMNDDNPPVPFAIIRPSKKVEYHNISPKKVAGVFSVYVIEKVCADRIFMPIYFGKTRSLTKRIGEHLYNSRSQPFAICKEIKQLQENGISIRIRQIDAVSENEADRMERSLIKAGRRMGLPLVNVLDGGHRIPVIQYTLDKVYIKQWASIREASKALNIGDSNISVCCKGRFKTAGGYIWCYADDALLEPDVQQPSLFDSADEE